MTTSNLPTAGRPADPPPSDEAADHKPGREPELALAMALAVLDASSEGIICLDDDGRILEMNRRAEGIFGYERAALLARPLSSLLASGNLAAGSAWLRDNLSRSDRRYSPAYQVAKHVTGRLFPIDIVLSSAGPRTVALVRDLSADGEVHEALGTRARQHELVAQLGMRAMNGAPLPFLLDAAVAAIAEGMGATLCQVFEYEGESHSLVLRAGVGYAPEQIGRFRVDVESGSQAGYTLSQNEPVLVDDLRAETRFRVHPFLQERAARSGVSVVIHARPKPFGVLSAYSSLPRRFTPADAHFLQMIANVISAALQRMEVETTLRRREDELRTLANHVPDIVARVDRTGRCTFVNAALEPVLGIAPERLLGHTCREAGLPDEVARQSEAHLEAVLATGQPREHTFALQLPGGERLFESRLVAERSASAGIDGALVLLRDVTDRQRAMEALRRQALVFENMQDAVILRDSSWRILDCNAGAERLLGYTRGDLLGTPVEFLAPATRSARYTGQIVRAAVQQGRWQGELSLAHIDGSVRICESIIEALYDDEGRLLGYVGVHHDVTAQRRALAALRESEERFRLLVTSLDDLLFTLDREHRFTNVFGMRLGQGDLDETRFLGRSPTEVFGEPTGRRHQAANEAALRGEASVFEWQSDALGTNRWWRTSISPLRNDHGIVIGGVAVCRDITDRKRTESALQESDERYQVLARSSHDVVFDWDIARGEIAWNQSVEALCGEAPPGFHSGPEWWYERIHADDRARVRAAVEAGIEQQTGWMEEYRVRRATGQVAVVLDRGHVLRAGIGESVRAVGMVLDLTERKQLEERVQAAQRMEAVGRLAGGVAHDFNNLLTAIRGHNEMVLETLGDADPRRDDVDEINRATERAASLTRQLLAFSRQQVLQPKVLSLNAVITDMQRMLRRLIGEDIALITQLDDRLGNVKADAGQLEQILLNLAVNARDAMPGGGRLVIETSNAELSADMGRGQFPVKPGQYVLLEVSDTGCGMSPEVRARIFEPFFTTKREGAGTGLGLSTVYGIVKQSDGYIWVYSEPDKGTTFKIYLPLVEEHPEALVPATPVGTLEGKETILIVEDEEVLRRLMQRMVERFGYTVLTASNGVDALRVCERFEARIDLVVSDVIMPEMGGKELFERLTAVRPEIAPLYISGYTGADIARRGLLQPDASFLPKPLTAQRLVRRIREILDARKGR